MSKNNKTLIWGLLSIIAIVAFPVSNLFFRNFELVKFKDALQIFCAIVAVGGIFFALFYLFLRSHSKAALLSILVLIICLFFRPIELAIKSAFNFVQYWHLIYLLITLIVLLAFFVDKQTHIEFFERTNQFVAIALALIIFINFMTVLPKMVSEAQKERIEKEQIILDREAGQAVENVYIFIFDEYAGIDGLLRYTGYDNSPFYEKLEKLGFNTSPHSRNYSTSTNIEVPNLLNLSRTLTNENWTLARKEELLKDPNLFAFYKQQGYFINVINDQTFIPADAKNVDRMVIGQSNLARTETFQLVILKNTILYPIFVANESGRQEKIKALFDEMERSVSLQDRNLLTVSYAMFPHIPWVLDENGNSIPVEERENWHNPDAYLGQLKYVSKRIVKLAETIIEKDPDCIILFVSDHGYRLPNHLSKLYGEPPEDPVLEYDYQINILNAVYYKGEVFNNKGLSGVNTLIGIINRQFSTDMPLVD